MPILLACLMLFGFSSASPVTIKVEDVSGAPIKNELVIVQNVDRQEREIVRALTGETGTIQPLELSPGLYRAIATAPYGLWQTKVCEFLVTEKQHDIILRVQPIPTHGVGDIVITGSALIEVQVLNSNSQIVTGASVLSRDSAASLSSEKWYKTDETGLAHIKLVGDPTVLVVSYRDALVTKEVHAKDSKVVIHLPN
jgi:hypothetical protein